MNYKCVEVKNRNESFLGPCTRKAYIGKVIAEKVVDGTTIYYVQTCFGDIDKLTEKEVKEYQGELPFLTLAENDLVEIPFFQTRFESKRGIVEKIEKDLALVRFENNEVLMLPLDELRVIQK